LKKYVNKAKDFMGPVGLFGNYGFTVHGETEDRLVMRKWLK